MLLLFLFGAFHTLVITSTVSEKIAHGKLQHFRLQVRPRRCLQMFVSCIDPRLCLVVHRACTVSGFLSMSGGGALLCKVSRKSTDLVTFFQKDTRDVLCSSLKTFVSFLFAGSRTGLAGTQQYSRAAVVGLLHVAFHATTSI